MDVFQVKILCAETYLIRGPPANENCKEHLCREIYMLCTPDKATARAYGHVTWGSPSLALFVRAPAYLSARRSSGSSARAPCGDGDARRKKIVGAREGQGVTGDVLCTR
jgi:hypothetical protein